MKKILFADDDPTIRDVIHLILDDDYQVTTFTRGEPLMKNEFEVPDLFLLDRQLSDVDGLDLCRHLKKQSATKDIPIIIISASPNITALARSAGADNVIEKPFLIQELRQMIVSHL
jgi:CheY-like chemotaxis protein